MKWDLILIAVILVVIVSSFAVVELTKEPGAYVVVKVDGQEQGKYYLNENGEYELNGGTNILRIEDGRAYLLDASCPDKLCVNQGAITRTGETITCLPNKLTVTVYGAEEEVDIVA